MCYVVVIIKMAFRNIYSTPNSTSSSPSYMMRRSVRNKTWSPVTTPVPFRSAYPEQLMELQNTLDVTDAHPVVPSRSRTMKEYDQEIADLKKENFSLKLDIYLMEKKLLTQYSSSGKQSSTKSVAELTLEVEALKNEVFHKHELLLKASEALEALEKKHRSEMQHVKNEHNARCQQLELRIKDMEKLEEKRMTEESDSRHSMTADWYKQAFSLLDLPSDGENPDVAGREDHSQRLSNGELLSVVESQRATIQYLTESQENHMAAIERFKVNRMKLEKVIKGLSDQICRYRNELGYNISSDGVKSPREPDCTSKPDVAVPCQDSGSQPPSEEDQSKQLSVDKSEEVNDYWSQVNDQQLRIQSLEKELGETFSELESVRKATQNQNQEVDDLKVQLKERDDSIEVFKKTLNKILLGRDCGDVEEGGEKVSSLLGGLSQLEDMLKRLASWRDTPSADSQMWVRLKGLDLIQESQAKDGDSLLLVTSMKLTKEVEDLQIRLANAVKINEQLQKDIATERRWMENNKEVESNKVYQELKNEIEQLNHQLGTSRTMNELLQQQLNLTSENVRSQGDQGLNKGILRIENEIETLKADVRRMQIGLKSSGRVDESQGNAGDSSNAELIGLLRHSQTEINRLRFLLDSTEGTVRTLSGKVQFYRRLLDEANLLPMKQREPSPKLELFKGPCRSAPTTPSKEESLNLYFHQLQGQMNRVPDMVSVGCQTVGVNRSLDCTLDSEADCNQTKDMFRTRLEELVEFLEKLLNFDGDGALDVSSLTPENLERFHRYIEHGISISHSLSRSLIAWENSTCFGDEQSSSVLADEVSSDRKRLSVSSKISSSVDSPRRRLFKSRLTSVRQSPSKPNTISTKNGELAPCSLIFGTANAKVHHHEQGNRSVSESDVWSEPDLDVSKQRIGLTNPEALPHADILSSTESDLLADNGTAHLFDSSFSSAVNQVEVERKPLSSPRKLSPRSSSRFSRARSGDSCDRKRLDDCLCEISTLKQQLQQSAKNYNSLLEEFDQWLAANSSSAEIYDKYKDTVQQLQAFIKQLKSEIHNKDSLICDAERERNALVREVDELTEKFESYQETIESLQRMLKEQEKCSKDSCRKVELLEIAIREKEATLEEAIQSQERTTSSLNKATRLLTDNEILIKTLQDANQQLESDLERDRTSSELTLAELKDVNEELTVKYESGRKMLEEQQRSTDIRIDELNQLVSELERENLEVQQQLTVNHLRLRSLEENREEMQSELAQLKKQRDEAQSSSKTLKSKLDSFELSSKCTVDRLNADLTELKKENVRLQSLYEESKRASPLRLTIGSLEECSSSINSPESASSFMYMPLTVGSSSEEGILPLVSGALIGKSSLDDGFDICAPTRQQQHQEISNTNSSPDLGIESDQSRFSSLDRQHKDPSGVENKRHTFLEPGFPTDTNWNVVNSAPAKAQRVTGHCGKPLNHTYHGAQADVVTRTQFQDGNDSAASENSPNKLKLLRKGNVEGVKLLREIRRRIRSRLVSLRRSSKGAAEEAEYEAWRGVYGYTDDLKECLAANDQLLAHILLSFKLAPISQTPNQEGYVLSEEEWQLLQLELAKERERAEDALKNKDKWSEEFNTKWGKAISKQLTLTCTVLQKARSNMEKRAKKDHVGCKPSSTSSTKGKGNC